MRLPKWSELKDLFFDIITNEGCIYIILMLTIITICATGYFLLTGLALMALWNWLAPIFWTAAPVLTYWQGVGLSALFSIFCGILRGGRIVVNNKN